MPNPLAYVLGNLTKENNEAVQAANDAADAQGAWPRMTEAANVAKDAPASVMLRGIAEGWNALARDAYAAGNPTLAVTYCKAANVMQTAAALASTAEAKAEQDAQATASR